MSGFFNDLRFSMRQLIKRPGFAAAAIITLALGIGANTAVFSVLNGYLLKPLPYPHGERLVQINSIETKTGNSGSMSAPNYLSIKQDAAPAFSGLAAWSRQNLNLETHGQTRRVRSVKATASLFDVLKMSPFLGHAFTNADQQPGRDQVAVLSYNLWQRLFGGNPNAIGRTLHLDSQTYTIIGVMPKGFAFPDRSAKLWVPYVFSKQEKSDRGLNHLEIIGRLANGVSRTLANQRLRTALRQIARISPLVQKNMTQSGVR
jgi:hypothetical protein